MSSVFTRPTQAEFLNTVKTTVGYLLPEEVTETPETPELLEEVPEEAPADTDAPTGSLNLDLALVGGATQAVTITGSVSDDNLKSYTLKINGTVIQEVTDITETTVNISASWNVVTPDKAPSGTYTVTLEAMDEAGNPFSAENKFEVDNDGPSLTMRGGDIIIKGGSIAPEVSTDDPHGIGSYTWRASERNPASLNYDETAKEPTFTPNVEGSYTFYLEVTDGLGNVSSGIFEFGYTQQLATVPLPVANDPIEKFVNQGGSTPAVTPASTTPATRSERDNTAVGDDAGVLGKAIAAVGLAPAKSSAAIAPTERGWSIFGVLWYWWLVVAAACFAGWMMLKKFVMTRLSNNS